ncbi:hypothetical protein HD806DRAFT_501528 [Xylariaceae sp. AK1471]|nr:hypothetical protein HD806DRAFT_501528 [Xylariaceae sp. AK1471]
MFASWRVGPTGSRPVFRNSPTVLKACKNCRAKKVKCTGELSGCQRCETLDINCTYTPGTGRKRRISHAGSAKKKDEPTSRQSQDAKQPAANTGAMQPLPEGPVDHSNIDFVRTSESNDVGNRFIADMEQWSAFSDFGSELSTTGANALDFQSTPSSGYPVDMMSWDETQPSATSTAIYHGTATTMHNVADQTTVDLLSQTHLGIEAEKQVQFHTKAPARSQVAEPLNTDLRDPKACNCLQRIVLLINELETSAHNLNGNDGDEYDKPSDDRLFQSKRGLDSALGLHKEALCYGDLMRRCQQCSYRSETRTMLLLLANRLVVLCTEMVSSYDDFTKTSDKSTRTSQELAVLITVGDYEADSYVERDAVLQELVAFQLRALQAFLTSLSESHRSHSADFRSAKNRITALLQRLFQCTTVSTPSSLLRGLQQKVK